MLISDFKHGLFKYEVKDYYAILGVPISQDPKEIRKRYLRLAYKLHPDTNQAETKAEKEKASDILSKIINPAYENLHKPKLRKECELIFSEISKRLVDDVNKITLSSEIAKKLLQETSWQKLEKKYTETVLKICEGQYKDLNKIQVKVGLLSELNLIYLIRRKQNGLSKTTGRNYNNTPSTNNNRVTVASSGGNINKATVMNNNTKVANETVAQSNATQSQPAEQKPATKSDSLVESARAHIETANFEPAMFDLREAVKEDSSNAEAHALLGTVYLQQRNVTYAKIHINKAVGLDEANPEVKKAKEKLDKIENKGKKKQSKSKTSGKQSPQKGSKKSSDKKKDKKEAPKIFGISLW